MRHFERAERRRGRRKRYRAHEAAAPLQPKTPPEPRRSERVADGPLHAIVEQNPDPAEIAAFAHSLWEARGCPSGTAQEDWLNAEMSLKDALVTGRSGLGASKQRSHSEPSAVLPFPQ